MKILNQFPNELSKRDAYRLTKAQSVKKMSEAAGSVLNPTAWVLYEDLDNKSGEVKTVLTIEDNGEIFGTISGTFIREFCDAAETFENEVGPIKVIEGVTRSGRKFITCELA
jgi:accessory colonization factor AcfC